MTPEAEQCLFYGPTPARPVRAGRDHIALMSDAQMATLRTRASSARAAVTLPCTPLLEDATVKDGSTLLAQPWAGVPLLESTRRRGMGVIGATGSGKTYTVLLPLIAGTLISTTDSMVLLMIKGAVATEELRAIASSIDPSAEVIVFSPADPFRSIGLNLLAIARRHGLIDDFVRALVSATKVGSGETEFWIAQSRRFIHAALAYMEIDSIAALAALFNDVKRLAAFAERHNDAVLREAVQFFTDGGANGSTSRNDLCARLSGFVEGDALIRTTSVDEFDLSELTSATKRCIFVIEANEMTFASCKATLSLLISMILAVSVKRAEQQGGTLQRGLSLLLDEFGAIPAITDLPTQSHLLRSRGISLNIMVQSLSQLAATYGNRADVLLAGLCTRLWLFSGLSQMDREYASRCFGNISVREWRETQTLDAATGTWVSTNRTEFISSRPLVVPEDFSTPPHPVYHGLALLSLVDEPPMFVHPTPAWEIPWIAAAMEHARKSPIPKRSAPLPAPIGNRRSGDEAASPGTIKVGLETFQGPRLQQRLDKLMDELGYQDLSGAARHFWVRFRQLNRERPHAMIELCEQLLMAKRSLNEFYRTAKCKQGEGVEAILDALKQSMRESRGRRDERLD